LVSVEEALVMSTVLDHFVTWSLFWARETPVVQPVA